jgi:hypothetical protein
MHAMLLDSRLATIPYVVFVEPDHTRAFCWVLIA